MWTSLARGLMAIRGYTQEVEDIYADVLAQPRETGEPSDVVPLLREPRQPPCIAVTRQRDRDRAPAPQARRATAGPCAPSGRDTFASARTSCRWGTSTRASSTSIVRSISSDPQRQASGRLRLGASPGIVPYTTSAFVLWSISHPRERSSVVRVPCAWQGSCVTGTARRTRLRGIPRHVAQGLVERARAGVEGARHRRGARLPGGGRSRSSSSACPKRRWDVRSRGWRSAIKGSLATRT